MVKLNEKQGKVHFIIIWIVRIILLFAFAGAYFNNRPLVLFISLFALFITFLPSILHKKFGVEIPAEFEVIIILFIYGTLFFGEVRGYYARFWWWDILLNMGSAIALGFVGLTILYVLYKDEIIDASPFVITAFAFCFSVAVGTLWEIFEFSLDNLLSFNLQKASLTDTMKDIMVNSVGALIVSIGGYFYIKNGKISLISGLVAKFVEKNPKLFRGEQNINSEKILNLIKQGESEKLEFKSTLRVNIHTNDIDAKIEHSVIKTIVAYLNSNGGVLLIGVSDKGIVTGIEKDRFVNNDKLSLHFTNLVKQFIGNEYLPFIKSEIIQVNELNVVKIDCQQSDKPVFLIASSEEEFYVRNGPSSSKLTGHALIDYVKHKFKQG